MNHYLHGSKALMLVCLVMGLLAYMPSWAQLNYTHSATRTVYVPLTGANSTLVSDVPLGADGTANTDDGVYLPFSLPFTFTYNARPYTSVVLSTNGVVFMGNTGGVAYSGFFTTQTSADFPTLQALFPIAGDLSAATGSVRTGTIGTTPNRKFVIQVSNFYPASSLIVTNVGAINMQIVLSETTNEIAYHFGYCDRTDIATLLTVGIHGNGPDVYTLGNSINNSGIDSLEWVNPARNITNNPALTFNSVVRPNKDVKYTFTPFAATSGTDIEILRVYAPSSTTISDSSDLYFAFIARNVGLTAAANNTYSIQLTEALSGNIIGTTTVNSTRTLAYSETDTIYVGPLRVLGVNNYRLAVTNTTGDVNVLNDTKSTTFAVSINSRRSDYNVLANPAGTYTPLVGGTVVNDISANNQVYNVPLPSQFWYNGAFYNDVSVSSNGFIAFGNEIPALQTYPVGVRNAVYAFGSDINVPAGGITYGTRGTSFVIQYAGANQSNLTNADSANLNFQIVLNANGTIEMIYGEMNFRTSTSPVSDVYGFIGLSGGADSVFYNLTNSPTNGTWNPLTTSYSYDIATYVNRGFAINNGYTLTWNPKYFVANDLSLNAILDVNSSACAGSVGTPRLALSNAGTNVIASATINVTVTNSTGTSTVANINYNPTTPLASGAHDTISLGAIPFDVAGRNVLTVNATLNGDGALHNNRIRRVGTIRASEPLVYADTIVCSGTRKVVRFANNSQARYYSDASLATQLGTDSLVYSSLNADASFYMVPQSVSDAITGGLVTPEATRSGQVSTPAGLVIFANRNSNLASVTLYPTAGTAGDEVTIQLQDSITGVVLAENVYSIDPTRLNQAQVVNLTGFNLNAGRAHLLLITSFTGSARIHRNTPAGSPFPIAIPTIGRVSSGFLSIAASSRYYYFFNLKFSGETTCATGGTYRLHVGNAAGTVPTISAVGNTTICFGDSVVISAPAGAANYRWSNGEVTRTISAKRGGSYTVQTAAVGGCFSASSNIVSVTVNAVPATRSVTTNGPINICGGGSVVLSSDVNPATGAEYLWSNGATTRAINVTTSGTYSVRTRNNATSCYSLPSTPLQVNIGSAPSAPVLTASGSTSFCPGDSVTISSNISASIYQWSNGATTSSITVRADGTYNLRAGSSTACLSPVSNDIIVTVNAAPSSPTITASGSTSFCSGAGTVTLTASASPRYLWSNGETTQAITVISAGSYTVQALSAGGGCPSLPSAATQVTVGSVPATPIITAGGVTTFCTGGSVILSAPASSSYIWSNGSISRTILVNTSGTYTVQVTNVAGCTSAVSNAITVTVQPLPSRGNITATGNTDLCIGGSVILNCPAVAGAFYEWFNGTTSVATTQNYTANAAGNYYVQINNGTCTSLNSDTISINILPAPNTPTITNISGLSTVCSGTAVQLNSSIADRYLWSSGDTNSSVTVINSGTYTYTVRIITLAGCTSAPSAPVSITVNPTPAVPQLLQRRDSLFATGSVAQSYRWLKNGQPFTTDSSSAIKITDTARATYSVTAANGICRSSEASIVYVLGVFKSNRSSDLHTFPVPAESLLNILMEDVSGRNATIILMDAVGKEVLRKVVCIDGRIETTIDLASIPAGAYHLMLNTDQVAVSKLIVKN